MVQFNRTQDLERVATVTSDNYQGGYDIAQFLAQGGHQRPAYIAGWEGASTQRDREAGFLDGLKDAGLTLFARGVGNFEADTAKAAACCMFGKRDAVLPDAVFVANDHMAFAVMDALRFELGLRVPQDVSVVGYDDVPPAAWTAYDLTTVRQRANRMVEATVAAMLEKIDHPASPARQVVVDAPLIIRGSARKPKGPLQ